MKGQAEQRPGVEGEGDGRKIKHPSLGPFHSAHSQKPQEKQSDAKGPEKAEGEYYYQLYELGCGRVHDNVIPNVEPSSQDEKNLWSGYFIGFEPLPYRPITHAKPFAYLHYTCVLYQYC